MSGEEQDTGMSFAELWGEARLKVGSCVVNWGGAMAVVYEIPKKFKLDNYKALQLCLSRLSGDEQRIQLLIKLLNNSPETKTIVGDERFENALDALKKLNSLSSTRNAIIHGLPVYNMHADGETREIVRNGLYLVQTRQPEGSPGRYEDLLKLCDRFDREIIQVRKVLDRVSVGISASEILQLINDYNSPN